MWTFMIFFFQRQTLLNLYHSYHGSTAIRIWYFIRKPSSLPCSSLCLAGRLGLLDYDEVELSNLHRQVLHGEDNQGQAKALSAANAVRRYWLAPAHIAWNSILYRVTLCVGLCTVRADQKHLYHLAEKNMFDSMWEMYSSSFVPKRHKQIWNREVSI